jgi:hypothetical protein
MTREAGTQNQIMPYVPRIGGGQRGGVEVGGTVDAHLEDVVHDKVAATDNNEECHMHPSEERKLTPEIVFFEGGHEAHEA